MIVQKDRIENYLKKKTPREGKRGKKKKRIRTEEF